MSTVLEKLRQSIAEQPEGEVLSSADFHSLGSRSTVGRALGKLVESGELLRLERGLYTAPVTGRFGRRPPAPAKVLASLGQKKGERVFPSGAASAHGLGLTSQVPIREVYLTSGRSRRLSIGPRRIQLRHAPPRLLKQGIEGAEVRAQSWLSLHPIRAGKAHVGFG